MIQMKSRTKKPRVDAPIDPDKLKAYVTRIEAVEELIVAERDARTDIYTEVKASGMKPKMVRKIVKERAKKAVDEAEEAELERYRAALAMPGATYRSVAAKTGVPKSTLHRLVPRDEKRDSDDTPSAAPHDREDDPIPPTANPHDGEQEKKTPSVTPAPSAGIGAGPAGSTQVAPEGECLSGREARSDEHSTSRSPAFLTSDSDVAQNPRQVTEPVEPTGNEGWAGERDLQDTAALGAVAGPSADQRVAAPDEERDRAVVALLAAKRREIEERRVSA